MLSRRLLLLACASLILAGCSDKPAKPGATSCETPVFAERETTLATGWKFLRIDPGMTEPAGATGPAFDAGAWESVTLPHTVRIEPPITCYKPFLGVALYRRVVEVQPEWKDKRVTLFFEGAMQVAEVWVNGEFVTKHEGGYTPFAIDLTDALAKAGKAIVTVRVDNTHKPLIPPGKPNDKIDFCYFGGLYRDVRLRVSDKLHLTDAVTAGKVAGGGVFARYENVSEKSADVLLSAEVKNDSSAPAASRVRFTLRDVSGAAVAESGADAGTLAPGAEASVSGKLTVTSPELWHPDSPYRYTLVTDVLRDGKVVDTQSVKLGIRSVAFNNDGFSLNGKPFSLRGANRHQDYPWLGNAVPDNAGYRDIRLLKEAGYNFIRLCHYPQSPAIMDACDELGVMVSVCTPGWQYLNRDEIFINHARQNIRDMVRWHRNHPSAVMWEVSLNETYGGDDLYAECAKIAHAEYPGDQMLTSGDTHGSKSPGYLDVPYTVWVDGDRLCIANPAAKWTKAFAREYGDYNFGGQFSTSRVPLGAGEEALLLQAWNHLWSHNHNLGSPWFGGDAVWAGIDDASGFGEKRCPVSWWGPIDYNRLPKFSAEFFRSQRSPDTTALGVGSGPVIFIANYWTPREGAAKVVVFSNCDEVELFLNGKSLGRRKPDSGPDTRYGEWHPEADVVYMVNGGENAADKAKSAAAVAAHAEVEKNRKREKVMFDGGNGRHLDHAPFTFAGIAYAPGELRAVGYLKDKAVSEFTRRTPGKPAALRVEVAENGRPLSAGGDAVFVRAYVVDANGTVVPENGPAVTFTVTGAARAIGAANAKPEAGIASLLVTSAEAPGRITVTAESPGLAPATLGYTTKP